MHVFTRLYKIDLVLFTDLQLLCHLFTDLVIVTHPIDQLKLHCVIWMLHGIGLCITAKLTRIQLTGFCAGVKESCIHIAEPYTALQSVLFRHFLNTERLSGRFEFAIVKDLGLYL